VHLAEAARDLRRLATETFLRTRNACDWAMSRAVHCLSFFRVPRRSVEG
jgi:hypothetical protein